MTDWRMDHRHVVDDFRSFSIIESWSKLLSESCATSSILSAVSGRDIVHLLLDEFPLLQASLASLAEFLRHDVSWLRAHFLGVTQGSLHVLIAILKTTIFSLVQRILDDGLWVSG